MLRGCVVASLLFACGCTSLADPSGDCANDQSCVPLVSIPPSIASCMGNAPPTCTDSKLTLTTTIENFYSEDPVSGLLVGTCATADVPADPTKACAAPALQPAPASTTVTIPLPARCNYRVVMVVPPTPTTAAADQIVPFDWYFNVATTTNLLELAPPITMLSQSTVASLASVFRLTTDPTNGLTVLRLFDCSGNTVPGVTFRLQPMSPGVIPFVFRNASPVAVGVPVSPDPPVTDETGQYGFANVPPGQVRAQAYLGTDTSVPLGDSFLYVVRAAWGTIVDYRPRTSM